MLGAPNKYLRNGVLGARTLGLVSWTCGLRKGVPNLDVKNETVLMNNFNLILVTTSLRGLIIISCPQFTIACYELWLSWEIK